MSSRAEELSGGVLSIVAVGFVTWMIFWMKSAGRTMAAELRGRVDRAVQAGGAAVVGMAFVAVAREGLETAVLLFSAARVAGSTAEPLLGFVLGLATAVLLGWLLYRRAITVDLGRFFRLTGILLILVAAGVLAHGFLELQEAGVLPGEDVLAFDVSGTIPATSWFGAVLTGILVVTPRTTVLQAVAWVGYASVALVLFLRPRRSTATTPQPIASGSRG